MCAEAGKVLLGSAFATEPENPAIEALLGTDKASMMEAMDKIANNSPAPLTKTQMRARLIAQGFASDRMGNYFYTCVARLKAKHRITVEADGSIWKAPVP